MAAGLQEAKRCGARSGAVSSGPAAPCSNSGIPPRAPGWSMRGLSAGWTLLLAMLALLAPPAAAAELAEAGFSGTPRELDLGPQGAASVPVTVFLEVATGCAGEVAVPVAVDSAATDGLRAAFERAEAVLRVPPGPGPHRVEATLGLAVSGVGPGVVTMRAQAVFPPESCLGLAGAEAGAGASLAVAAPPAPRGDGTGGADGTRPIVLAEEDRADALLPTLLLVAAGGMALLVALRGRSLRGA